MRRSKTLGTVAVLAAVAMVVIANEGPNGQKVCTDDNSGPNCNSAGQSCTYTSYSQPCTSCVAGSPTDNCVVTGTYTVDVTVYSNGTCTQIPGQPGLTCSDTVDSGPTPTSCQYTSS